jgi:hypothetical protein
MSGEWVKSGEINVRPWGNGVAELQCPRCGFAGLHHTGVLVFDRTEDAVQVTLTSVQGGKVAVDTNGSNAGNPSSRRDGIVLKFECEGCGNAPIEMTIAQHKGSTEIGWRYVSAEATGSS